MSSFFSVNKWRWVPFILYALVCSVFWIRGPVHYGGDSVRYIRAAEQLLSGQTLDGRATQFLGYIYFVAGIYCLNLGNTGVVLAQAFLGGLAVLALYDLGKRVGNPTTGVLAASIFAMNVELHQWTFYVLTESLFITFVIFVSWAIYCALDAMTPWRWILISTIGIAFLTTIRPNGWLMFPVFTLFLSIGSARKKNTLVGVVTFIVSSGLVFATAWLPSQLNVTHKQPGQLSFWGDYTYELLRRGEVIWGYDAAQILMPSDAMSEQDTGLGGMLKYCFRHSGACLNLLGQRLFFEMAYWRPYYSKLHTIGIVLILPFLYVFAALGIYWARKLFFTWLVIVLMSVHFLFVTITWVDYNGRFLLYVLPLISLFSALGIETALGYGGNKSGEIALHS